LSAGSIAVRPGLEDVEFITHVPILALPLPNAVLGQVLAKEPPVDFARSEILPTRRWRLGPANGGV
jgi:hypothetical protein